MATRRHGSRGAARRDSYRQEQTNTAAVAKKVYIRLTDDGTGLLYTVKYGWFSLPARRVRLLVESGPCEQAVRDYVVDSGAKCNEKSIQSGIADSENNG
jgi:hypothetical protein